MTRPDRNPAAVYVASMAPAGRPTVLWALRTVAAIAAPECPYDVFPWHGLRYEHVAAIRAQLVERYEAATVNKVLSFLRGVLRAAWNLQLIHGEDYHRATAVKSVRGKAAPAGRALGVDELDRLAAIGQDGGLRALRDAAIVAAMYGAGLRRQEVCSLDVESYADGVLKVRGKGNKTRLVPVVPDWQPYIVAWRQTRTGGPMFVAFNQHGPTVRRLTVTGLSKLLGELRANTGVAKFTPHDLRRSFATHLFDAGVDPIVVRDLMGHENIATTARYDRRNEAVKAKAVEKLRRKN